MPSRSSSASAAEQDDGIAIPHLLPQQKRNQGKPDVQSLRQEVASFAANLGLQAHDPSAFSGFNDVDFRRKGPIAPQIKQKKVEHEPDNEHKHKQKRVIREQGNEHKQKQTKFQNNEQNQKQKKVQYEHKQKQKETKLEQGNEQKQKQKEVEYKQSNEHRQKQNRVQLQQGNDHELKQVKFHKQKQKDKLTGEHEREPKDGPNLKRKNGIDRSGIENHKKQKFNPVSSTAKSMETRKPTGRAVLKEDSVLKGKEKEVKGHSASNNINSSCKFSSQVCKQVLNSGVSETSGAWYEASQTLSEHLVPQKSPGQSVKLLSVKNQSTGGIVSGKISQRSLPIAIASPELVDRKRHEGQLLLDMLTQEYQHYQNKDSASKFLLTARRAGTSADKVAAMTVMVQGNPLANLSALDTLFGFVTSKGGKRKASLGIDVLKELFVTRLLPDRKLKFLKQQPLATLPDSTEGAMLLLYWFWEDSLKDRYAKFVHAVVEATKDTLPYLKQKALKTVYELLKAKPEQEQTLLSALINKLGDPERKVSSTASYLLSSLLAAHPNMKKIVVAEVESFVFRPHVGLRARYYAAVFLNQLLLSNRGDGPEIAKQLIDLYFAIFKVITMDKDESEAGSMKNQYTNHHEKKKMVKNTLMKAQAKEPSSMGVEMDSRLLSALLTGVNRAFPYVKDHDADNIIQEHTPMLFHSVHSKNLNVGIQALMLLYQLLIKNQAVSDRFFRALYAILLSEGLVKSSKVEMFLSLVFKAMKTDINLRRVAAFAKRLMQVALQMPPEFSCGSLVLISEVLKARPPLWDAILVPALDDDMEHFLDVEDPENESKEHESLTFLCTTTMRNKPGEIQLNDHENSVELKGADVDFTMKQEQVKPKTYDPRSREPSFCNADQTCWWELSVLAVHFHPSVAVMAHTLLSGVNLVYGGDPLHDLSLGSFLDRFAEKKPKDHNKRLDHTRHRSQRPTSSKPVGVDFQKLPVEDVAPEDIVFHKFYASKALRARKPQKKQELDSGELVGDTFDENDILEGDDSDDDEIDALLEQDDGVDFEMPVEDDEVNESDLEVGELDDGDVDINEIDESDLEFVPEISVEPEEDESVYHRRQTKNGRKSQKFREVDIIASEKDLDTAKVRLISSKENTNSRKRKKSKEKSLPGNVDISSENADTDFSQHHVAGQEMQNSHKGKRNGKGKKRYLKSTSDLLLSKSSPFASSEQYAHLLDDDIL